MRVRYSHRIPNFLSLSRVPLGGVIIIVYSDERPAAFLAAVGLVLLALVTDVLDGYFARRLNVQSKDGYLLDGLGDRSVYIALLLTFYGQREVWSAVAWLLVLREVGIYAIRVVQVEWDLKLQRTRTLSLAHAFFMRLWFGLMLLEDGFQIFGQKDIDNLAAAKVFGATLLAGSLTAGYLSIYATMKSAARSSI